MATPITPLLTVDIIIELNGDQQRVLLIERANPPYGWALPGGFVDIGETVEQAACREAKEETGLNVHLNRLLGVYSNPKRDPRHHTVSIVYTAQARGQAQAGDDARHVQLFSLKQLPQLAFDHADILADYQRIKDKTGG